MRPTATFSPAAVAAFIAATARTAAAFTHATALASTAAKSTDRRHMSLGVRRGRLPRVHLL